MKIVKKISLKVMIVSLTLTTLLSVNISKTEAAADSLNIDADAAILLDADSGQILYEKNADTMLGVASMSKMMTEYLVNEAIANKKITWEQEVTINSYVHKLSGAPNLSNIGLTEGQKYTVKELYQAMAVYSGNGATVALAQLIAGSEKNFVKMMNDKAEKLGLKDYKFVNSSGLNNKDLLGQIPAGGANDENLMSARSISKLAYSLLRDYPGVLETSKIAKLKFKDGKTYPNFNWMLPGLTFAYQGVDGLKTGSTDFAGACFAATAKRNDFRVISVVMKCKSKNARFQETRKMLDYAFNNFVKKEVVAKGTVFPNKKTVSVKKGKETKVAFSTKEPISLIVHSQSQDKYQLKFLKEKQVQLTAPIKKGKKIGEAELVVSQGQKINFIDGDPVARLRVDLVTNKAVEKASWFTLTTRAIGGFFSDIWDNITGIFD